MPFSYLTNTPLDEARCNYLKTLSENGMKPDCEAVPVQESQGRITLEPVYAHISSPHYNACAMDGIALNAALTFGAGETTPVTIAPGDYVPVDTGDPLPDGCDAVVMIEDVIWEGENARLYAPSSPWRHVRQIGEDVCAGDMLLASFSAITPAAIGVMLGAGVLDVKVSRPPVVGVIPTGDEITAPVSNPGKGDIIDFNSSIFSAMLASWGAKPAVYPIVKDDLALITSALEKALGECDAVILNAGASAGREDYSAEAIGKAGEVLYHGIAIKPGKPTILGFKGAKPILGVPGYPVSGIVVVEQFVKPIVDHLLGRPADARDSVKALLSRPVVSTLKYHEFVRVQLGYVEKRLIATPLSRGAGVVSSFLKADGILEIPQDSEGFEAGKHVRVKLRRPLPEIKNALVVTGSHDPLIDELAELLRLKWKDAALRSSHVGSMGGVMAIRSKAAHVAGIHLLDENTGEYNLSYVKKYFPGGGVALVECVKRIQGLMVQKGNPKGIKALADMAGGGLRYVNRQKGSGTRILCDYLCKNEKIDAGSIYGYSHEEFTHTAVAALIASDGADAGIGIYSAAGMYGLDFIPICEEQYDFLITESELGSEKIERLLDVLKSRPFLDRLGEMGGYAADRPGRIREISGL